MEPFPSFFFLLFLSPFLLFPLLSELGVLSSSIFDRGFFTLFANDKIASSFYSDKNPNISGTKNSSDAVSAVGPCRCTLFGRETVTLMPRPSYDARVARFSVLFVRGNGFRYLLSKYEPRARTANFEPRKTFSVSPPKTFEGRNVRFVLLER